MKLSYKRLTLPVPVGLLRWLKGRMRYVRAAGGIVTTPDGSRALLILRNGRWDLPKGKVEPGETLQQAALREVQEETGISNPSLLTKNAPHSSLLTPHSSLKTYHLFNLYGGWHLKQTSWFAMVADEQPVRPQAEEGITGGEWVPLDEARHRLRRSYGTLRTLSRLI